MAIPVTVLCGELGAGKTTLLSHVLESAEQEIAVLVNDVGAVNVGEIPQESRDSERGAQRPASDADLVAARTDLATGEDVVALENGCICCSLGNELSRSVIQLWQEHDFEHLIVEASGVGEPEPIARQFVRGPAGGPYDLDAVVTVVDARRFHDRFVAGDAATATATAPEDASAVSTDAESNSAPQPRGPDETGARPIADLVLEQVEFCDLLVVNKCDLVDDDERDRVLGVLETLQPRADVVTAEYGAVDPNDLLDSERFDLEAASESAGWKRVIEADEHADDESTADGHHHGDREHDHGDDHSHGHEHDDEQSHGDHSHEHDDHSHDHDHDHAHPPERYGIAVEAYHRRRPFHPERFAEFLTALPDGLVRAKGLCWIAGREDAAITMSYAGTETTLEVTGRWIASFPEERRETYRTGQPDLAWDEEWGDRETRLALIGRNVDFDAFETRLDECLLTDVEMDADWLAYENPAPTGIGETTTISTDDD